MSRCLDMYREHYDNVIPTKTFISLTKFELFVIYRVSSNESGQNAPLQRNMFAGITMQIVI